MVFTAAAAVQYIGTLPLTFFAALLPIWIIIAGFATYAAKYLHGKIIPGNT